MTSHSGIARCLMFSLAIGCCAVAGVAQSAKSGPIQITIDPGHLTFVTGTRVDLRVEVKNISDHEIAFSPPMSVNGRGANVGYRYHVRAEDGSTPKAIPLPDGGIPMFANHVIRGATLKPGQSAAIEGNIGEWYDLTAPGKYRIYAFQGFGDPGKIVITKSNEVTVTILPNQKDTPR